jgi:secondary thiamine-phosphate synthase enzyme
MQKEITIKTTKRNELVDISEEINSVLKESKVNDGVCVLYVPHATAAVIINENYDPNICDDFTDALKKLVPEGVWRHDRIDGNADAHIKAAIVGPSEIIPIKNGKLQLGTWQSPMVADFDGPRSRKIIIKILGD